MSSKLKVIGSGSQGNSYALYCGSEILLIELGLSEKDIKKAIDFEINRVVGCIASHTHGDHLAPNTVKSLLKYGLNILSTPEASNRFNGVKDISKGRKYKLGSFFIQPIPVEHNVECYAFIIEHESIGKCLFATDLNCFPSRIKGLNHIFIEANYSEDIIVNNACRNSFSSSASNNHLDIEQTIEILKQNYSSDLQTVVLLHLSDSNSNASEFLNSTREQLGFQNVYIAEKGLIIELNKEEF
ncbi:MAG: MBL fold metallo-hydrolase [Bacteroidales bacterium]